LELVISDAHRIIAKPASSKKELESVARV